MATKPVRAITAPPTSSNRRQRQHPDPAPRRWGSIHDVAMYLGVTTRTVRQMVADGRLTGYRNGGRLVRIDLNEVDARMEPFGGGAA